MILTSLLYCLSLTAAASANASVAQPSHGQVRFYLAPELTQSGDQLEVTFKPASVRGGFQNIQGAYLSGLLADAVAWLATRQKTHPTSTQGNVFNFPFRLTWRTLDGDKIERKTWRVLMGYGGPGYLRVTLGDDTRQDFEVASLFYPEGFAQLLQFAVKPGEGAYPWKGQDEILLELTYSYPKSVSIFKGEAESFPLASAHYEPIQLSISRCVRRDEQWRVATNIQATQFGKALAGVSRPPQLNELQKVTAQLPSNRFRARQLLEAYKTSNIQEAWQFARHYQPFFVSSYKANTRISWDFDHRVGESIKVGSQLERGKQHGKRRALYRKRANFKTDPKAWVDISSPADGDMVAGHVPISFVVAQSDPKTRLLVAECLINGKPVAEVRSPPFFFYAPVKEKENEITVRVSFENETRVEDTIRVQGIPIMEEEAVKVANLQVVGLDKRDRFMDLDESNLVVKENGKIRDIGQIYRDDRPLDVVVLLDTSLSMWPHIYKAQLSVNQFLENLQEQESATVYSFDEHVQRVVDWEMSQEDRRNALFTMTPRGSTAMYDALLTARSVLLSRDQVTKAIVVIADGNDTSSLTRADEIEAMMDGTPIRVYSFLLGDDRKDQSVLERLCENSGGKIRQIGSANKLDRAFDKVLHELRSLYFVSYHTGTDSRKPRLSVRSGRRALPFLRVD